MDKIMPCPVCGHEEVGIFISQDGNTFWAFCKECGVEANGEKTEKEAFASWNNRAIDTEREQYDASRISRKDVLLKACYELLQQQEHSPHVLNLLEKAVFYDGVECDGHCLMEDIAAELEIES